MEKQFLKSINFLLKDFLHFGASLMFSKLLNVLIFFYLAKQLTINDLGIFDYIMTIIFSGTTFIIFGLDSGSARYFIDKNTYKVKQEILSQSLVLQLFFISLFILIAFFLYDALISGFKLKLFLDKKIFFYIVAQIPLLVLINFASNILKWSFERNKFILVSLIPSLIVALMLFTNKFNLDQIITIYFYSRLFVMFLAMYLIKNWIIFPKKLNFITKIFNFSFYFGLITIITSLLPVIERYLISSYLDTYHLGLYAVAVKISVFILLPIEAFNNTWHPYIFSNYLDKFKHPTLNFVWKFSALILFNLCLLITIFSKYLIIIFASTTYLSSAILVLPLMIVIIIENLSWTTSVGIGISKKTYFSFLSYVLSLFITLILMILFIHKYGLVAIPYAALIGYSVKAIISSFISNKLFKIKFDYYSVIIMMLLVLLAGNLLNYDNFLFSGSYFLKSLIVFAMFNVLSFIFLVTRDEIKNLKNIIYSYITK